LLGFIVGTGVVWLRASYGAYDHYAYFGGLGKAGAELLVFNFFGLGGGFISGYWLGRIIARRYDSRGR
jgi:hypothetical protein